MNIKFAGPNSAIIEKFRHPFFAIIAVFIFYFTLAILLTWPLLLNLDTSLFGDYGDTRGGVWWIWAKTNGFLNSPINNLIAAPYGTPNTQGFSEPILEYFSLALAHLTNEVAAYNLFALFSWSLTAFATYYFIWKILGKHFPALICGAIFGFCPGAVMQATAGHSAFSFNVFIPVLLGALIFYKSQRTYISLIFVATAFSLITLTSLYFGYFAIYIVIYFVVYDLLSSKKEVWGRIFKNCLLGGLFAAIFILPFEYKEVVHQFTSTAENLKAAGQMRDFNELNVYSSRYWDFITPSIDHPVLGKYFIHFTQSHLHESNVFEQTLYLGLVPIGLFVVGLMLVTLGKFDAKLRMYYLFFAFGALWMYFLTLPPQISIGTVQIPTISYFAYKIAPMFRVYARFGILVNFFVACSVSVVLVYLYQHLNRVRYYILLSVLLPVLVFECWSIPNNFALPINKPPEVYSWLSQQPGDFIVAEYPMMNSDEASFNTYLFWQRIHKKKLINGATRNNEKAWSLFEKVQNLASSQTPELLKSVGVKYVIVHGDMYKDGPVPLPLKRYCSDECAKTTYNNGLIPAVPYPLRLLKKMGSDYVFSFDEVNNKSALNSLPHLNGVL